MFSSFLYYLREETVRRVGRGSDDEEEPEVSWPEDSDIVKLLVGKARPDEHRFSDEALSGRATD